MAGITDSRRAPRVSAATLRRLAGLLAPLRWRLLAAVIALLFSAALQLALAPLANGFTNAIQRAAGTGHPRVLVEMAVAILAAVVARSAFTYAYQCLLNGTTQRLGSRLREAVFEQTLRMPHSFFDDREAGAVLSRLSSDVPTLQQQVSQLVSDSIAAPFMIVGGVVVLLAINWQLSLIALLSLPPIALLITRAGRLQKVHQARVQQLQAEITALVGGVLTGARVVKAFSAEEREVRRFDAGNQAAEREILRSLLARSSTSPLIEMIAAVAFVLVLGYGGYQIISGSGGFRIGGLLALVLVLERVSNAARQAGNISMCLGQASATAERIFSFLDLAPAIADPPSPTPLGRLRGDVEFERVAFSYSPVRPVLREFSLRIPAGRVMALVGRSGSGKSTLCALIPRFYDVNSGRVLVDGVDVRQASLAELRAQVATVPQDVHLFSGAIRENIAYGCPEASAEQVEAAARAANAHAFILALPNGYETEVGERGARLSGGQRQRIAIARALLRDPRILLLDEATASLDSESEKLVQEALERLMEGRTTLVVAHRLATIRHADEILVLEEGRIVERGTHEELLRGGGAYARLHYTQFSGALARAGSET